MKIEAGERITCWLSAFGWMVEAAVVDKVYADRTCGQYESGWIVVDNDAETCCGTEYFVSDSGIVWKQPENVEVGIAPTIKEEADRTQAKEEEFERRMDQA
jgi:hypothetical protein